MRSNRRLRFAALAACWLAAACSEGGPTEPEGQDPGYRTITVNASTGWAYVDLQGDTAVPVLVPDASTSAAWDLALFGTSTMLNGGAAGPGALVGHCLCRNENATADQVMAFTAQAQLPPFVAVATADVPGDANAWASDALSPAITGWYSYNPTTHAVSARPERAFYLRLADGASYAKLRIAKLESATAQTPGRLTVEWAVQGSRGAPIGAVQSAVIDVPAMGKVPLDLNTGTQRSSGWDIAFEGYAIRVNAGVSGTGTAGAIPADEPFGEITDPSAIPATVFKADAFGGVFDSRKWYRYNLTGTDHQIWPTFDVYLIKRGSEIHKVQLISYYGPAGETRQITFRYARIGS